MKLHERYFKVSKKKSELQEKILNFMEESDLTDAELLSVLTDVFSSSIGCIYKDMIRMERHGTTDKKGDEA